MNFKQYLTENKETITEGKLGNSKVDFLENAYGREFNTYPKLFAGIDKALLSKHKQFFIDKSDKQMPIKLIDTKTKAIVGIGISNNTLMPLLSRAIFDVKDAI